MECRYRGRGRAPSKGATQPNWILYQYHVDYAPVVDSKRTRVLLMRPHDNLFGNRAFDGSTIYSPAKLPEGVRFLYFDCSKFLLS